MSNFLLGPENPTENILSNIDPGNESEKLLFSLIF